MFGWEGDEHYDEDDRYYRKVVQLFDYNFYDMDDLMKDYRMFEKGLENFIECHSGYDYDFTIYIGDGSYILEVEVWKNEKRN